MQKIWFKVDFNNNYDDVTHTDAATPADSEDMRECECVLALPDCYTETGEAVPLILSSHGAGGRVCRDEDKTGGLSYVTPCIEAGYAAFDIHGTRPDGNSIGNRRYLEAAHRAYVYVLRHYNVQEGLFVAGASMGGHNMLNFTQFYPRDVRVVGLFYPRSNMRTETACGKECIGIWDKTTPDPTGLSTRDRIAQEYAFSGSDVFETEKTVGLNPYHTNTLPVNGKRVMHFPCPLKIWHGTADQTNNYELSVEFVEGIKRGGGYAVLRTLEGRGHKLNDVMREELRMWFDRFR